MKKAFITGITGQTGSYLAEIFLDRGYEVHGLVRRVSHPGGLTNIEAIKEHLTLHVGSLASSDNLTAILAKVKPDVVASMAAQSHVGTSYEIPVETMDTNATGTLRLFEAVRAVCPEARVYQASTSEQWGYAPAPQNEDTPFNPTSTYSVAKVAAHLQARHHRNAHGMFIACGILCNHESPRRPDTFVTRKITKAAARIALGLQRRLVLGNLDTGRDWGYAKEYAEAIVRIIEHSVPDEFVIATGRCVQLREFLSLAFSEFGLQWEDYVETSAHLLRPQDHFELRGDSSKAKRVLGWEAQTQVEQLVKIMCAHDLRLAEIEKATGQAA